MADEADGARRPSFRLPTAAEVLQRQTKASSSPSLAGPALVRSANSSSAPSSSRALDSPPPPASPPLIPYPASRRIPSPPLLGPSALAASAVQQPASAGQQPPAAPQPSSSPTKSTALFRTRAAPVAAAAVPVEGSRPPVARRVFESVPVGSRYNPPPSDAAAGAALASSSASSSSAQSTLSAPPPPHTPMPINPFSIYSAGALTVNRNQHANPVLHHVRSVAWEFGDIVPDFVVGRTGCILYLTYALNDFERDLILFCPGRIKYHRLNREYIYERIKALKNEYALRVLILLVDVVGTFSCFPFSVVCLSF